MISFALVQCGETTRGILPTDREPVIDHPGKETMRLDSPDPQFKLSPDERASIRPGFDVDALERLLAAVEPDVRPLILESFQQPKREEIQRGDLSTPVTRLGDPALQPLLDEVWVTAWERFAPDLLDSDGMEYPGKQLAKQRRALRSQQ